MTTRYDLLLGISLKAYRKRLGRTAKAFASEYDIPIATYHRWEAGKTRIPLNIAEKLGPDAVRDIIATAEKLSTLDEDTLNIFCGGE